ncbi:MAG: filamentous hemagglutinin N-terminal domain-containing protein [Candidatus Omnitrophica bacterium]|nr:filamentous hemagglutinin N-terminal domain-containing protein [Candidatus Omnitrophota bacterium]
MRNSSPNAWRRHLLGAAALIFLWGAGIDPPPLLALPSGTVVEDGSVEMELASDANLHVHVLSEKAILGHSSFDITAPETVEIHHHLTTPSAALLSRVYGGAASEIAGTLLSNGLFALVNPAGIHIADSATIDAAKGFIASTLNISNANFLAGNLVFESSPGQPSGAVVNEGRILTYPGELVALLGGAVENKGSILAELGSIVLAAGEKLTLSFDRQGWFGVTVEEPLSEIATGLDGKPVAAAVEQSGTLSAAGGHILVKAEALPGLFDKLVSLPAGLIEAASVVYRNGQVELVGKGGTLSHFGAIRADGTVEAPRAGGILVEATRILQGGTISANAGEGGAAGSIQLISEETTSLLAGSRIEARASGAVGEGGSIRITSTLPKVSGSLFVGPGSVVDVSGGSEAGDAGFIELSARSVELWGGRLAARAADGSSGGRLLIDPLDLTFDTSTQDAPTNEASGTPDIAFDDPDTVTSTTVQIADITGFAEAFFQAVRDIIVNAALTMGNNNDLRLEAGRDINLNANVRVQGGSGHMTLIADADFSGDGGAASDGDGTINQAAGVTIQSGDGDVVLQTAEDFTVRTIAGGNGGTVSITSTDGNILDDGDDSTRITTDELTLTANASGKGAGTSDELDTNLNELTFDVGSGGAKVRDSGSFTLKAPTVASGGSLDLRSDNDLTIDNNAAVTVSGSGTLTLIADADASGAGGLTMNSGSSLVSGSGKITLDAGDNVDLRTVTSDSGDIEASSDDDVRVRNNMTTAGAGKITLTADSNGNGSGTFIQDSGVTVATGGGDIAISGADDMTLRTINAGAGDLTITAVGSNINDDNSNTTKLTADKLTLTGNRIGNTGNNQIDTSVNEIDVTAGGDLLLTNDKTLLVTNATANGSGSDITLVTTSGDLLINLVSATGDLVTLTAAGAITESGSDAGSDLLASQAALSAASGIGTSGDSLETTLTTLAAQTTSSGGVFISNTGTLSLGTVGSLTGVTAAGGGIRITASSPLTVDNAIADASGGTIELTASGSAAADDLTLNANVTASGGNGSVSLEAGDGITHSAGVAVSAAGAGTITYTAGTGTSAGVITVSGPITSQQGEVKLSASDGVTLSGAGADVTTSGPYTVDADSDDDAAGTYTQNNAGSAVAVTDNTVSITAADIALTGTLASGSGDISFIPSTADRTIGIAGGAGNFSLTTAELTTQLSSSGTVTIGVNGGTGAVDLNTLSLSGESFHFTVRGGDIGFDQITLAAGKILQLISTGAITDTNADTENVTISGSGSVLLDSALGVGSDADRVETNVETLAARATTSGGVFITEANEVTLGTVAGVTGVTTGDGSIQVTSGGQMTAGLVNAEGGDATLVTESGDLLVGDVSAENTITLTSAGAIEEDGEDDDPDLTAETIDLNAEEGIGSQDTLELATTGSTISADTTEGDIDLSNEAEDGSDVTLTSLTTEEGNLTFSQTGQASLTVQTATTQEGEINITNDDGDLTVDTATATGGDLSLTTVNSGNVSVDDVQADDDLTVNSAGSITESGADAAADLTADDLDLSAEDGIGSAAAPIETNADTWTLEADENGIFLRDLGDVTLLDFLLAVNGSLDLRANGTLSLSDPVGVTGTGTLTLASDADGNGTGSFTQAAGQDLTSEGGTLTVTVGDADSGGGNLSVRTINAGAGTVSLISRGGSILEAAPGGSLVTGNTVNLTADQSIGNAGSPVRTNASTAASLNAQTTAGDIFLTELNDVLLGSLTAGGNITVTNLIGNLLVNTVIAGGSVSLTAQAGDILDNNGDGLNLKATGSSSLSASGVVGTLQDPLDVFVNNGSLSVSAASELLGISVDVSGFLSPVAALAVPVPAPPGFVIFNEQIIFFPELPLSLEGDLMSQILSFLTQVENQRRLQGLAV